METIAYSSYALGFSSAQTLFYAESVGAFGPIANVTYPDGPVNVGSQVNLDLTGNFNGVYEGIYEGYFLNNNIEDPLFFVSGLTTSDQYLLLSPASLNPTVYLNIQTYVISPSAYIESPCFLLGTRVATPRGEVAVEQLAIGDRIRTITGEQRAIRWIGYRAYTRRLLDVHDDIAPILIRANALAEGVPKRDLYVSPLHAMYIDGVLIPAKFLINGASILKAPSKTAVEYYHLELDTHDIILAEGAASETYLDDNNRAMFHNAAKYAMEYPDAPGPALLYCAPRVTEGYKLKAIRCSLAQRAGLCGAPTAIPLRGFIDRIATDSVEGWAQNPNAPEAPVCIDVLIDGIVVAQTLANRYRRDLAVARLGSGNHGFSVHFSSSITPRQRAGMVVRRSSDHAPLERRMPSQDHKAA